jgi:hypothetical protein
MTDYYCKSTGSNTSPYDTWAKACTDINSAIALAVADDRIFMHNGTTVTYATSTTLTPVPRCLLISTADTSNAPPTTYDVGAIITSSTNQQITVNGGHWYGFLFKSGSGASSAPMNVCTVDNAWVFFEDCQMSWTGTGAGGGFVINSATSALNSEFTSRNCTWTWSNTGQGFTAHGVWHDIGSNMDAGATHPLTLFKATSPVSYIEFNGSDLSGNANTYFAAGSAYYIAVLINCKLSGPATIQATLSNHSEGEVFLYDCDSGDGNYQCSHYNFRGSTVVLTSKYVTADGASYDGTNRYSYTIQGSANASFATPYYAPWIEIYNASLTAQTPYFEIARDGSTTPYTDGQVWAQFLAKDTSGFPRTTHYSDRRGVVATAQDQATGTGTGNWTGLSGTAWSGKCDSGAAITFAELGSLRGRLVVAANISVQLDPKIRGIATVTSLERVQGMSVVNGFASAGSPTASGTFMFGGV